ncbi:MAG: acetoacetyl-CoA reductase [Candidatus Thiodiazotropha lotti]|uniref:Beta-ketoacyl-ACP reductase n=1 Tax=Candidatus Thiodiazotropha endoloripes TaxID=1818881 RepID=A0A1E2URI9_9GAMM|nr:acetoacetyl-CoA reductase [Candidatus Thiodiazotropha endoloripes]MCG7897701.1 acetoacetyl-CoA reductase [Candidatus Thiodiazotropha weberae]MCG7990191.1 acetoacetyl-CoA reductase [Candidatus Thiodiazotropha lotti]MCG7902139.1 acetoacetyl-CoA reductase [Candidatus Thiodiazotropha weberae]MCG7913990.1 acetoacetyl-CoA reductase [Candidatus Thiodiazotropha weberae]MCG7999173.1 acetoacetyl-CoA reductase [Candidatus Thiodiazotropha lotti]
MSCKDKLAVVTGGLGGIGTAVCLRLAEEGAKVVATCHPAEADQVDAWKKAQQEQGAQVEVVAGDVSTPEGGESLMNEIVEKFGQVDILVNCAGITRDTTMKKMTSDQWDAVIDTNLSSVFYVTRPVWTGMVEQGFGRIINISSVNGQRGQFGQTNYSAAKAGMHGFSMALAYEGAAKGVTVNTVSPGYIETAMTAAMRDDVREAIVGGIPMRRMGQPEEIAQAVAFLADDASTYVTGANLPVNGGLFIH